MLFCEHIMKPYPGVAPLSFPVQSLITVGYDPSRSELPEYLSETELRNLLEYSATKRDKRDLSIISFISKKREKDLRFLGFT